MIFWLWTRREVKMLRRYALVLVLLPRNLLYVCYGCVRNRREVYDRRWWFVWERAKIKWELKVNLKKMIIFRSDKRNRNSFLLVRQIRFDCTWFTWIFERKRTQTLFCKSKMKELVIIIMRITILYLYFFEALTNCVEMKYNVNFWLKYTTFELYKLNDTKILKHNQKYQIYFNNNKNRFSLGRFP